MHTSLRPGLARRDTGAFIVWQLASLTLVYLVPSLIRLQGAPFAQDVGIAFQAWIWATCFLLLSLTWHALATWRASRRGHVVAWLLAATAIAAICWGFGWIVLSFRDDAAHSRMVAVMTAVLGTGLAALPYLLGEYVRRATVLLVGTAGAAAGWGVVDEPEPTPIDPFRMTALVPLVVTDGLHPVDSVRNPGGALTPFREGFLLVSGAGSVYQLNWVAGDETRIEPVRLPLPPLPFGGPVLDSSLSGKSPLLRATGIAVDTTGPRPIVLVAHERWRGDEGCLTMAVSAAELEMPAALEWSTVFVSAPCLRPEGLFDRLESGGRLVLRSDGKLLLSLGDFGLIAQDEPMAQLENSDYGKVLLVSRDGTSRTWSRGHRNPQGLTIDRAGQVWSTEHGPQGGDELNLLRDGNNHGWPFTTYGTAYGSVAWDSAGMDADSLTLPIHAFVPSIGISNLLQVRGPEFNQWFGDLLVGSLRAQTIYRVRLNGATAAYVEPIQVGQRIRDLAESADGGIAIWTDDQTILTLRFGDEQFAGARAYEACIRCHATQYGPSLMGVIGRNVASEPFAYSPTLRQLGGTWTVERLDEFLRDPKGFAPGNSMDFPGIENDSVRAALIRHLGRYP